MRFIECRNDTTIGAGVRAFARDPGLVRTAVTELQLHSEAGRAFLPGIQQLFDEGVTIPPARAAALMVDIAAGRCDMLADRMLSGVDDRHDLAGGMDRIVAADGRVLQVTGLESAVKL